MSETCTWFQDGDEGSDTWVSQCDHYFRLDEGTPTESRMAYCCFCGKPLVSEPFKYEDDDQMVGRP